MFVLFVAALFAYSNQIYPYIHFHHSHENSVLPFELSLHPVEIEPEHIPNHHDDEHNHELQQYFERGLPLRQQTIGVNLSIEFVTLSVRSTSDTSLQTPSSIVYSTELNFQSLYLQSTITLRSPPVCC